jgi:hypothetical protein
LFKNSGCLVQFIPRCAPYLEPIAGVTGAQRFKREKTMNAALSAALNAAMRRTVLTTMVILTVTACYPGTMFGGG